MSARCLETLSAPGMAPATRPLGPLGPRPRARRPLRVLYPPLVKRPPPKQEEPNPAKRWLLLLSAVLFLQVYTEEGLEGPQGLHPSTLEGPQESHLSNLEGSQGLHLYSLEETQGPHLPTLEGPQGLYLSTLDGPQGTQTYIQDSLVASEMRDSAEAPAQTWASGSQWLNPVPLRDPGAQEQEMWGAEQNQSASTNSSA